MLVGIVLINYVTVKHYMIKNENCLDKHKIQNDNREFFSKYLLKAINILFCLKSYRFFKHYDFFIWCCKSDVKVVMLIYDIKFVCFTEPK